MPQLQLASNRHCSIQLHLENSTCLTVMAVYLPSSNYSQEEYQTHFCDFQSAVASFETSGPVILLGDINVDKSKAVSARNYRNDLFDDFISAHDLCVISQSRLCQGPNYTYFSTNCSSTLDYIICDISLTDNLINCFTHTTHPLNLSDHFPISLTIDLPSTASTSSQPELPQRTNWHNAVNSGVISQYQDAVSLATRPLLCVEGQSIDEVNNEILHVGGILLQAASDLVPTYRFSNRSQILNSKISVE